MHALNALPAAAVAPALVGAELLLVVGVLLPHAASAMAATEATATIFNDDLKALSPLCITSVNAPTGALFVTLPVHELLCSVAHPATPTTLSRDFFWPRSQTVSRNGLPSRPPVTGVRRWRQPAHPRQDRPGASRTSCHRGFSCPAAPWPPAPPAGTRRSPRLPETARSTSAPATPASGPRRHAVSTPAPGR